MIAKLLVTVGIVFICPGGADFRADAIIFALIATVLGSRQASARPLSEI